MGAVVLELVPCDPDVSWLVDRLFERFCAAEVAALVWELFRGYAVNGAKEADGSSVKETELAELLDRLVQLVNGLERERKF